MFFVSLFGNIMLFKVVLDWSGLCNGANISHRYSLAGLVWRRDSTWSDRVCRRRSSFATTLRFLGATHCALVLVTCSTLLFILAVLIMGIQRSCPPNLVKSNAATSTSILAPDSSSAYQYDRLRAMQQVSLYFSGSKWSTLFQSSQGDGKTKNNLDNPGRNVSQSITALPELWGYDVGHRISAHNHGDFW